VGEVRSPELSGKLAALGRRGWLIVAVIVVLLGGAVWVVLTGSLGGSQSRTAAPATPAAPPPLAPLPPAGIALSGWKLSLPETGDNGDAASIEPATLKTPWLTPTPGGGLMFWAPAAGATTKNSDHARTELQSLTYFQAGSGVHTLSASLTLLQLPQDGGGIILGQIHGGQNNSSVPYVMLRVQDNKLRVVVKQVGKGKKLINYPLLDNIGLNTPIDYTITDLGNGTMTFSATYNGQTRQATAPVPAKFLGQTVRFQAGDYEQADNSHGPSDGGRVVFHRLTEQHTNP
jgi:hypothetical protein